MYTLFKHSASPSSVYISWLEDFFSPMFSRPFRFLRSSEMLFVYSINSSGVSIALCWCDDLFQPRFCFRRLNGRKRPSSDSIFGDLIAEAFCAAFDSKLINRSMQREQSVALSSYGANELGWNLLKDLNFKFMVIAGVVHVRISENISERIGGWVEN